MDLTYMTPRDVETFRDGIGVSSSELAWLIGLSEKATRRMEKYEGRNPHPSAVRIMDWIEDGTLSDEWVDAEIASIPRGWKGASPFPPMSPEGFRDAIETLGIAEDDLAVVLNLDEKDFEKAKTRKVHPSTARIVRLILDGLEPPEWPKALRAEAGR